MLWFKLTNTMITLHSSSQSGNWICTDPSWSIKVLNNSWMNSNSDYCSPDSEGVTNLPHYKNSCPENLSGSEEKIGVFITKTVFAFPSGLILRMIWALNFEELDCLVVGFAFRLVKNATQMFVISQVLLQFYQIMIHLMDRILEAASELRHVKDIVDLG